MPEGLRPVIVSVEDEPASSWFSRSWPAVLMVAAVLIGLALSTLAGSAPTLPPAPTPAPWPGTVSTVMPAANALTSRRALLILLPGARPDYLHTYITDGTMHNLALLAAGGVVPEYVTPVEPAVTNLNLECLVRGSRPRLSGLFSGAELPALFTAPAVWAWDGQSGPADAVLFWPDTEPDGAGADIFVTLADGSSAVERPDAQPLHTSPAGLALALTDALGQPPALPSPSASGGDFVERLYRRLDWQARAAAWVWSSDSPRTMVIVFDALALAAEAGLLHGEDAYDPLTRAVYHRLDGALGTLFSVVDMARTATAVGTTNGLLSYQRVLNLEAVLRDGAPAVPPDAVRIVTAGGTAFLSIHLPADSAPAVQTAYVEGVQKALEGAAAGDQPALRRVAAGDAARQMGWADAGAGDFWVQAAPGVVLRAGDPSGEHRAWWEEAGVADGYASDLPEMRGFFVLAGPGITPYGLVGPISLLDIAPTLGALLQMPIPDSVQGRPLREWMNAN